MKHTITFTASMCLLFVNLFAQSSFPYDVVLEPKTVSGFPGLHSYAFGQDNGKWLFIGGRLDGLHARQPFNSFPASENNTQIFVVDVENDQVWSSSILSLNSGIREQLQSTNMSFYQDQDTLYLIGGYGFSTTQNQHITYPNLTSVQVPELIQAVINGSSIDSYFSQISDTIFAVAGGQLGKIEDQFLLVGGHRFDGQYNPHGPDHGPGFTQVYTNQIRKFSIHNSTGLSYSNYTTITDPIHLHRRDYNLVPYTFQDRSFGYLISSGVFQQSVDLPFLYPVSITDNSYTPMTSFNQYLSNYHSAKASLVDSIQNEMHTLFFGGMSRYYYQNGVLIEDDQVPFVKTISRLTRSADGSLHEYQLPVEMPGLKGASAEFIPNKNVAHHPSHMMYLHTFTQDSILIGHVVGGISSPSLHPFTNNQTTTTTADNSIFAVYLIRNNSSSVYTIEGNNPYLLNVYPNPTDGVVEVSVLLDKPSDITYYFTNTSGQILLEGHAKSTEKIFKKSFQVDSLTPNTPLFITVIVDSKYYLTQRVLKR